MASVALRGRSDELDVQWRMHLYTAWWIYKGLPVKGRHSTYEQWCKLLLNDGKETGKKLNESDRQAQIRKAYDNAAWFCPDEKPGVPWIEELKRQQNNGN